MKPRNNNIACSEKKPKDPVVVLQCVEKLRVSGLGFSPFVWKGEKKIVKIL